MKYTNKMNKNFYHLFLYARFGGLLKAQSTYIYFPNNSLLFNSYNNVILYNNIYRYIYINYILL
jgi:hypothetical protein